MEPIKTARNSTARWAIGLAAAGLILAQGLPAMAAPAAPTNVAIADGDDGWINAAEAAGGLTITGEYDAGDLSITGIIARVVEASDPTCDVIGAATPTQTIAVDGSGTFTMGPFDVSGFPESAVLCARARTLAGATNGDLGVNAIRPLLDRIAPGLPGMTFVTNPVNASNVTAAEISTTGGSGNTVEVFVEDGTTATPTQSAVFGSPATFSFDLTDLEDGTVSARATQADPAGNVSGVRTRTSLKDVTAPGAGLIEWLGGAADGYINRVDDNNPVPVSWTADPDGDAATAEGIFTDGDGNTPLLANCGSYVLPITSTGALPVTCTNALPEGEVSFVVDWTDAAGNTSTGSASVIIDRINPTPTYVSPAAGTAFPPGYTVPILGTTEPEATLRYRLDGVTIGTDVADESGNFGFELPDLTNGSHTVNVRAVDLAGNAGARNLSISVDPLIPLIADPTQGSIEPGVVTVGGTGLPDTDVEVLEGGSVLAGTEVDSRGQWELQVALAQGAHAICARASQGLTTSQCSPLRSFSVESTRPTAVITTGDMEIDPSDITGEATADGGVASVLVEYVDFVRGIKLASVGASCVPDCGDGAASITWAAQVPASVQGVILVRATSFNQAGDASEVATIRILASPL